MPRTTNSGQFVRKQVSLLPHHIRALAERSRSSYDSMNTIIRDALDQYFGFGSRSEDRVTRPFNGTLPPPSPTDRIPLPSPERANPHPESPPPKSKTKLKARVRPTPTSIVPPSRRGRGRSEDMYALPPTDNDVSQKTRYIPYSRVFCFWKKIQHAMATNDKDYAGSGPDAGERYFAWMATMGAKCSLSQLEAMGLEIQFELQPEELMERLGQMQREERNVQAGRTPGGDWL